MRLLLPATRDIVRALRLPFIAAGLLPFVAGSFLAPSGIDWPILALGLITVAATHLSANTANDFYDSRSGVDWRDPTWYGGLFGGSKLIQEGRFSERFYLYLALGLGLLAAVSVVGLVLIHGGRWILYGYILVLCLAWAYSAAPVRLSYRYMGEVVVFCLFGPAPVIAGYSLQAGTVAAAGTWLIALPYGLLTTAILVANEVPDHAEDRAGGKCNWVHLCGPEHAFMLYYALSAAAMLTLLLAVIAGVLRSWTLTALLAAPLVLAAGDVMRRDHQDKARLAQASRFAIAAHALVGTILCADIVLR